MSIELNEYLKKELYSKSQISSIVFDLMWTIIKIKGIQTVTNVYLFTANENLEIYVFYEKENFEIEDKITKLITDFEQDYFYFPEVFIYPLDMIKDEKSVLPSNVMAVK